MGVLGTIGHLVVSSETKFRVFAFKIRLRIGITFIWELFPKQVKTSKDDEDYSASKSVT